MSQDPGNKGILIFLLTKAPGDVTIEAVIANPDDGGTRPDWR